MNSQDTLQQLVDLSHDLGRPEHDLAILGEGNASAVVDDDSFLVKASGSELRTIRPDQIVRVDRAKCRAILAGPALSDTQIKEALQDAVADPQVELRPSVETVMHAALLDLPGINFVGHTHPTTINSLTCSDRFEDWLTPRLFPDHIVVCGSSAALVPYVDPGLPLAAAVLESAKQYQQRWDEVPKTIFLKNHGFIALAGSAKQVMQITLMAVKSAKILLGAAAAGNPIFMSDADVARIAGRDDEHYRQKMLQGG